MCTVTYIPTKENIYFTSNRDEKIWRTDAHPPSVYTFGSGKMIFPKDGDAGGTWIAAHENGNVVIFLNGGLYTHTPLPPYRKSRGLILIGLLDHTTPYNCFLAINLNGIEPFTAIIRDNGHLFECRWDGSNKHFKELDHNAPHIWSSVTLYDEQTILKRKQWFDEWINNNKSISHNKILHFHQFTGDGDARNDLKMNRDGKIFTVSICSVEIMKTGLIMHYLDLKNDQHVSQQLLFDISIAGS
ncbi:MAG TPA: NRDE family protein [Flavitalea sp.]|nr:NRDE family protein [Flavitalea sp.]